MTERTDTSALDEILSRGEMLGITNQRLESAPRDQGGEATIRRPPSPPPRGTDLPTVVTEEDYAKIPPGSWIVDEDGVFWWKPPE